MIFKSKPIYPFSCGSQYADWTLNNCDQCQNGYDDEQKYFNCDAQRAIVTALFLDGTVKKWVAKFIGYFKNRGKYIWHCPHKKPIKEEEN